MAIRREQGLLIAVVLLAAWMWFGREPANLRLGMRPARLEVEEREAVGTPLVPVAADAGLGARPDPFREPSEWTTLPPRPLPAPPLAELPVVALPLPGLGQHPVAWHQLLVAGEVAEHVDLEAGEADTAEAVGNGGDGGDPDPAPPPGASQGSDSERYARVWDRVKLADGRTFWGECLARNKYALARARVVTESFDFKVVEARTGAHMYDFRVEPDNFDNLTLADNLRNTIGFRELDITPEVSNLPVRLQLIDWLLEQAQREPWVYVKAEEHARKYRELSTDPGAGLAALGRVLRAAGRLADELALYDETPAELKAGSTVLRRRGTLLALLGLYEPAEEHLRRAQLADRNDPLAAAALAEFLLDRGRAEEALDGIERGYRMRTGLERAADQQRVERAMLRTCLALGRGDDARRVAASGSGDALLRGAVAYATGDLEQAEQGFRASTQEGDRSGLAQLGLGATLLRGGRWLEAMAQLRGVADRFPALRARALAGVGLLLERTGNREAAAEVLGEALVADPHDAYALYLRGRVLRLLGDEGGAVDALTRALRGEDELAEALAELAEVKLQRADDSATGGGVFDVDSASQAVRYADRAVRVDAVHRGGRAGTRLLEQQGLAHFRAGRTRTARAAFEAAREAGSGFAVVGLALVDYQQGRVDAARDQLAELDKRPLGDPFRQFGRATIQLIDDHAQKVEIRDDFARDDLGSRWTKEFRGRALQPAVAAEQVVLRGRLEQEVVLRRVVEPAGDFLAVEVDVARGAGDQCSFAGLQLTVGREGRATSLSVELGYSAREGGIVPALRILDGDPARAQGKPEELARFEWRELRSVGAATGPQRLRLEVVPKENVGDDELVLRAYWNGEQVAEEELQQLRRKTRPPLQVDLVVQANRRDVDVTFDSFRLRLRKGSP